MKISDIKKGFTLLEVLVSIVIITVGLAAALSLITVTISSAAISRDRLIAANLAQENLEVLRNIRDSNWLSQEDWLTGISTTTNTNVNYDSAVLSDLDDQLYFDGIYYRHLLLGENPNTPFKRYLAIDINDNGTPSDSSDDIIQAKSVVEWSRRSRNNKVELEESLYNWH